MKKISLKKEKNSKVNVKKDDWIYDLMEYMAFILAGITEVLLLCSMFIRIFYM